MKIGIVYDCAYPYSKGGVEKRIWQLTKLLAPKNDVHLFVMKYWQGKAKIKRDEVYYHGVCPKINLYKNGKRRVFSAIYFSFFLLKEIIPKDLDIIDCQNIPYFPCFVCKLYCLLKKRPLIITWHEVWGDYWYEYIGWKGYFGKILEKIATRLTENNIAVSTKTQRNFMKISKKRINVIPNGIDFAEIQEAKCFSEESDVLYVGRLIKEKNIDALIRSISIANLSNVRCWIIGDGPERKGLERLTKKLKLEKNVKFLGFVENVYSYMKASKIFVLPSIREGFGIVVIEANACGLPVLLLKHRNNAAIELISKNGFVCEDEWEIKAVLRRLNLPVGIELRLWSDVPPGSGLGSSAAMGVALLGLLSQAFDLRYTKAQIAELEFTLETEELGITGGRQDQYAAVFGGVSYMRFTQDGVQVTPLQLSPEVLSKLEPCLILCYTGASRLSGDVNQKMIEAYMKGVTSVATALRQIKAIAEDVRYMLLAARLDTLGELLNAEYRNRIQLTPEVITPKMQLLRDVAFQNGASGAKICGAGGGGCMLFTCDKQAKQQVISQLEHAGGQILPFQFENNGLQVFNPLKPHQHRIFHIGF